MSHRARRDPEKQRQPDGEGEDLRRDERHALDLHVGVDQHRAVGAAQMQGVVSAPAIDEAYDLRATKTKGVMIVDPGDRFADFEVGELRPGYVFWMVGNDKVENLRAMLTSDML